MKLLASDEGLDVVRTVRVASAAGPGHRCIWRAWLRGRGSRVVHLERPVKAGTPSSAALTEDDVVTMLIEELRPWLE